MHRFLLIGILLSTSCAVPRDPYAGSERDRADVLAVVEQLFDVIASKDVTAGARLVLPEGVIWSARRQGDRRALRPTTFAEWLASLPDIAANMQETFLEEPRVLIDDDVATVWGRYEFLVDGAVSHTGVDAFLLARTDDGWRMVGGLYNVLR